MSKNRIKLNICGSECVISSDDSESYIRSIGDEVEMAMEDIITKNERISITMAAIITALSYCDESHKATGGADNLRSQIKDYLEDSSRARTETEEAKRELERLRHEIQTLRSRLAKEEQPKQSEVCVEAHEEVHEKAQEETHPAARPTVPAAPVQRPQTGSYSRVSPQQDRILEQEGFMSFFEKKNEE